MKEPLEEASELAQKVMEATLKLEKIMDGLNKEKDNTKSYTLKKLLESELYRYTCFLNIFGKYIQLHLKIITKDLKSNNEYVDNSIKKIMTTEDKSKAWKMVKITKHIYETNQNVNNISIDVLNMALKNYLNIVSRNSKKWKEFANMLGSKITDLAADAIPGVSELKSIYENIRDIAELVNKFEENATDYSEVDKRLFEIEQHIIFMKEAENLFEQSIKMLGKYEDE